MRGAFIASLALIALMPCPRLTAAQPSPGSGGQIAGTVTTRDAKLLPGADVTLTELTAAGRRWTARTGPDGAFSFAAIPAGRYELSASAPGFTSGPVNGIRFTGGEAITLRENEQLADVSLTLSRTGSVAGRILQPEGTPASGVQVMLALRSGAQPDAIPETRVISAWDGRYEIRDIPPGEYLLLVRPAMPGAPRVSTPLPLDVPAAPLRFEPTLYPGVPESGGGDTIVVHEGVPAEGIDVWLLPAPQRYSVSGRVFWPEGLEVRNVVVEYGGEPDVRSGIWYIDDPGGLFTLDGISHGTLVMLARGESTRGPLAGMATTDVLAPIEDVRIVLRPTGSVSGRIVAEKPLPAGSAPRVTLTHSLLRVSPLYPAEEAVAAAGGAFEIPHALGTYSLGVRDLPDGWTLRRITRNGRPLANNRIVVESGESISSLEIVVGPGSS